MTAIGIISGMILFHPVQSFAQEPIKVLINGESLNFEVSPRIEEGTTLVPFRAIFEKLGLKVDYIDLGATGQIIKGSKAGLTISMFIGSKDVLVNDHNMTLEKPPVIIDGNTMVPLRFVGEVTGNTVTWNGETQTVSITASSSAQGQSQDASIAAGDFQYASGYKYKGQLQNNKPNGQGKLLDSSGKLVYEGGFKDGLFDGQGKVYKDGMVVLEGQFTNDKLNGYGKSYYLETGVLAYEGSYTNGQKSGSGKAYDPSGKLQYDGQWLENQKSGQGTFYSDDVTYNGQFADDKPNGQGTFKISNGSVYNGEVKDGKIEGKGTFQIEDGSKMVGEFRSGKLNGQGAIYAPSGALVEQGGYLDGKLISPSITTINSPQSDSSANEKTPKADDVLAGIQAKFSTITVGGKDLHFTYELSQYADAGEVRLLARISNSDYLDYLKMLIDNRAEVQKAVQALADDLSTISKNNGYTGCFLDAMYQDRYSHFPTSYKASELRVNDDGTVSVTHSIFSIYNGAIEVD